MSKNSKEFIPRLTFAALRGGSGKTIASLGVARALARRGQKITVFKKGPDYIDAAWLSQAAGTPCYNLDAFLMSRQTLTGSFYHRAACSDLAVIEGNRGLFDGVDIKGAFSTAQLAGMLGSRIILVVDCTKVTRTAAAMIKGCMDFEPDVSIAGIILNRVAGRRHESILRGAIEEYAGIPVLGKIPRLKQDPLPMRHLGLTPAFEYRGSEKALDMLADIAEDNIQLHRLKEIAAPLADCNQQVKDDTTSREIPAPMGSVKIGVIRDAAFQFYYPENLEALEKRGAELLFLNAVSDSQVPDMHGLYIGGGFPETQAQHLEANMELKHGLRKLIESGLPVYAECGGLMYLGRNLLWKDKKYQMLGVLEWDFVLKRRPVGHGYSVLSFSDNSPFFKKGDVIKGHEFHYSLPVPTGGSDNARFCCQVQRGHGFDGRVDGISYRNIFGTYTHIHALGNGKWGENMIKACMKYKKDRGTRPADHSELPMSGL